MATLDELLSFSDGVDKTLIIDNDLRYIHIPDSVKHLGVMSDDEVFRLHFKMPRYFEGIDLADFTVRINYLNAQKAGDVYPVKDKLIDGVMIEHANAGHVIVLGLSSGTAASRSEYEQKMRAEFGRYFISLRDYLSKYGLDDAGLTPTEDDLAKMAVGQVPQQLLADTVHYTAACKTVIGNMLYKKCCELNIFSKSYE